MHYYGWKMLSWSHLKSIEYHGRDNCLWEVIFILYLECHERLSLACACVHAHASSGARAHVLLASRDESDLTVNFLRGSFWGSCTPRSVRKITADNELTDWAATDGWCYYWWLHICSSTQPQDTTCGTSPSFWLVFTVISLQSLCELLLLRVIHRPFLLSSPPQVVMKWMNELGTSICLRI